MINFFQITQGDNSIGYLNQIFGSMNGILGGGGSISLLGTMFKTFNSAILAVGALLVLYVTIVGVMQTAHEGEFMGKKWNNIWIPIRTVLGIAALVPTGSGYSSIQIVMMWVIVQGIGAADMLWNTALSYVSIVGSPYAKATIPTVGLQSTLSSLYQSLVCDAAAHETRQDFSTLDHGGYYCANNNDSWCSAGSFTPFNAQSANHTYSMGPGGQCGTLTFCDNSSSGVCKDKNSLQCLTCTAQIQALGEIVPLLAKIAVMFQQTDYSYRAFFYTSYKTPKNGMWSWMNGYCSGQPTPIPQSKCCVPHPLDVINNKCQASLGTGGKSSFPDPNDNGNPQNPSSDAVKNAYWPYGMKDQLGGGNFINTAVNEYTDQITGAVTTYIQAQGQAGNVSSELSDAQKKGWIVAGSYYYVISSMNSSNLRNSLPTLSLSSVDVSGPPMGSNRNNFGAAQELLAAASGATSGLAANPQMAGVGNAVNSATGSAGSAFQSSVSTSGGGGVNPLAQLAITGSVFLLVAEITFVVLLVVTFVLGIIGNISFFVLGTGEENPIGPAEMLVYAILLPMIFGLLGIMISYGATLGVYVPLIPYIVYTFGVIGWFISVIETMVAGPLVALGIMSPSGQHELLGKAEPALMLLFDVFLRPSLMIFGLIAAMLLAVVVVSMINDAFWTTVMSGIGSSIGPGGQVLIYANPLELIIFLSAYIALIVAALNKCFAVISILPQGVMKWIGGQTGAQYGEAGEALGAAKEGVAGAAAGIKGAGEKGTGKEGIGAAGGGLIKAGREGRLEGQAKSKAKTKGSS